MRLQSLKGLSNLARGNRRNICASVARTQEGVSGDVEGSAGDGKRRNAAKQS